MSDFPVYQGSYPIYPNGSSSGGRANRRGEQVVIDFWSQLYFDGRMYHIQLGTEDAPINSTAAIDDQLVWAVVDNNAGNVLIPTNTQVTIANWTTATLVNAMLEADMAKKRYSSGGTPFVPRNLRSDTPFGASVAAYVGTDVTVAAKSSGTDSVELKRGLVIEDAQATPDPAGASVEFNYSIRTDPMVILADAASILLHFGATTADVSGYGSMQFASMDKGNAI
jgi:hypothetical protein